MKIVLYICLFLGILGWSQSRIDSLLSKTNHQSIPYISVEDARASQLEQKVIFLDAREWDEFEISHIPSAYYIGFSKFKGEKMSADFPDKSHPFIVYCSLGVRSEKIGERLKKLGYTNVKNLYGGIFEWVNKELPIEDNEGELTDNIHPFSKKWSKYLMKGTKTY